MNEVDQTHQRQTRGNRATRVYEQLRTDILTLELEPGAMLDEVRIAARFALSRSPVREALVRLASDGLVITLPNKSTMVAPLNVEDFPQYIDALDLLQRITTRLAATLRTADDLKTIRQRQDDFTEALEANDAIGMIETNRDFHVAIAQAGRNRYFTDAYGRVLDGGRRLLRLYYRSYDDHLPQEFGDQHNAIIAAIEAQDADLAERLAHEHAEQVGTRFLAYLGTRRTADFSLTALPVA